MEKLLLVDGGNTTLKVCLTPLETFKPTSVEIIPYNSLHRLEKYKEINLKVVSTVKPSTLGKIKKFLKNPYVVKLEDTLPLIGIDYRTPHTLGIDRVISSIGGLYYDRSFIKVSFGTATVVDVVINKTFRGGAIFPGLEKSILCLVAHTDLLPKVEIEKKPPLVGKDTKSCIQSGVFYSQVFTVKGFIERLQKQLNIKTVILTGGAAGLFKEFFPSAVFDPYLTFRGLYEIAKTLKGRK